MDLFGSSVVGDTGADTGFFSMIGRLFDDDTDSRRRSSSNARGSSMSGTTSARVNGGGRSRDGRGSSGTTAPMTKHDIDVRGRPRDSVLVAHDVAAGAQQFGPLMRAVLMWKHAVAAIWVAVITFLVLTVWDTDVQSMWRTVTGACGWVVGILTSALVMTTLDWFVWLASFGFLSLGTTPAPGVHHYAHGGADVASAAGGNAPYLLYVALFCASQVSSAALKYSLVTVQRQVYAPGIQLLRTVLVPPTMLVVACEAVCGCVAMLAATQLLAGHSLVIPCSVSADTSRGLVPARLCVDADAAFMIGFGAVLGATTTVHMLRYHLHVLSFPVLRQSRLHRVRSRVAPALLTTVKLAAVMVGAAAVTRYLAGDAIESLVAESVAYFAGKDVVLVTTTLVPASPVAPWAAAVMGVAHILPRLLKASSLLLLCGLLGRHVVEVVMTEGVDLQVVSEGVPGASTKGARASPHALMVHGMCQAPRGSVVDTFLRLSPAPLTGSHGHLDRLTFAAPLTDGVATAATDGDGESSSSSGRKRRGALTGLLSRLMWWRPDPELYTYDDRGTAGNPGAPPRSFASSAVGSRGLSGAGFNAPAHHQGTGSAFAAGIAGSALRQRRGGSRLRSRRGRGNGGDDGYASRWQGQVNRDFEAEREAGFYGEDEYGVGGMGVIDDADPASRAVGSLRHQALQVWRARFDRAERALYSGDCYDDGAALPRWRELARRFAFRYARELTRSDTAGRAAVFGEVTGSRWGELVWACTAAVDAMTLRLQVVSIRGVAPAASVFRPRRSLRVRERWPEWNPLNCVVEQQKWALGRPGELKDEPTTAYAELEQTARLQDGRPGLSGLDALTGFVEDDGAGGLGTSASAARWGYVGSADRRPLAPSWAGGSGGFAATPGGSGDGSGGGDTFGGRVVSSMEPDHRRDVLERGKQSSLDVLRREWGRANGGGSGVSGRRSCRASARRAFRRSPQQVTAALFDDVEVTMDAVETLAGFAAASRVEDEYGLVQNSLPVVVSSIVACLCAVEEYTTSPCFNGEFITGTASSEGHSLVRPQPQALKFVLRRAVYSIVQAFGLRNLTAPGLLAPRIASRVASFAHFQE